MRWGVPGRKAAEYLRLEGAESRAAQAWVPRGSACTGLRTLAVPRLLGVCLLRLGEGRVAREGGAAGSREGLCAPERGPGGPGPSSVYVPKTDGLRAGRIRPAPPCCTSYSFPLANEGPPPC